VDESKDEIHRFAKSGTGKDRSNQATLAGWRTATSELPQLARPTSGHREPRSVRFVKPTTEKEREVGASLAPGMEPHEPPADLKNRLKTRHKPAMRGPVA